MDLNLVVVCNLCGLGRWDLARGVVAVGQRDHYAVFHLAAFKQGDAETDGVAKGSAWAGHANGGLFEQHPTGVEVLGKGHLDEGCVAKDDQADTIAFAAGQKIIEDLLDRGQTINLFTCGIGEVFGLHRAREIDQQQQIAGRFDAADRRLEKLRAGDGQDQQRPQQQLKEKSEPRCLGDDGALTGLGTGDLGGPLEPRHPDCLPRLPVGWQHEAQERRQQDQQQ